MLSPTCGLQRDGHQRPAANERENKEGWATVADATKSKAGRMGRVERPEGGGDVPARCGSREGHGTDGDGGSGSGWVDGGMEKTSRWQAREVWGEKGVWEGVVVCMYAAVWSQQDVSQNPTV